MVPFTLLREFAAHEQELLARMGEHEGVIGAQVGETLPVVARHPSENGAFAVHHLVMRERQDEVLGEGVMQPELDVAVMIFAVHRFLRDVAQRVVHPPHVPFVAKAEPADVDRP